MPDNLKAEPANNTTSAQTADKEAAVVGQRQGGQSRPLLVAAAIVVATFVAYGPAMRSGFIWDDDDYVTNNRLLRDWGGLRDIWLRPRATPQYYPLAFSTFWTEYGLWELKPSGYHVTNVLLHAISAVVLWGVLRRLAVPGAALAAAIFALHPVCVESVAWITERKNVLSGLLYLLAALAYFRFDPPQADRAQHRQWRWWLAAAVLFALALLSKTVVCTLPAALMLVYWWKRPRLAWRDVAPLLPLLVLGAALALNTARLESQHVGAAGEDWALTFGQRLIIAGRALWFYAGKLLWPHPLTFIYPRWQMHGASPWLYLYPLAVAAVIVALVLLRGLIGKGPAVAVVFFTGTLLPALGFVNVYPMLFSFVADHFQYLASIGLTALLSAVLWRIGGWLISRVGTRFRPIPAVAAAVLIGALGSLTWRQCLMYRDSYTLWQTTVSRNPSCWLAYANLGLATYQRASLLAAQGRSSQAWDEYQRAAELCSESLRLRPSNATAQYDLSLALMALGRREQAKAALEAALRADPNFSGAHLAHTNLGGMLLSAGRTSDAIFHYRQAVKIAPDSPELHYNLGVAFLSNARYDLAAEEFRTARRLAPGFFQAAANLAVALEAAGRLDDAVAAYREALELNPLDQTVHERLVRLLAQQSAAERAGSAPSHPTSQPPVPAQP